MSAITAHPNPIVVDNTISPPETAGMTTVTYKKEPEEELWEMQPGASWAKVNVHTLTGLGDEADYSGSYGITLSPGQIYTAGLFYPLHSPVSTDPLGTKVVVIAVFKKPTARRLITDHSGSGGGTWLSHGIKTTQPTTLFLAGASRTPAVPGTTGIPQLVDPDAVIPAPLGPAVSHDIELKPLVPGHHYFLTAMVVDAGGNWEVLDVEQDTLKRKMTVQFPKMVVFNDGDWATTGEAEFWFDVSAGDDTRPAQSLQLFTLPEPDLDDWGETGRPYALGYAYIENQALTVSAERTSIWVHSWAREDDDPWGDDTAGSAINRGKRLNLPDGPAEKVVSSTFTMDVPASSGDLHYAVDVTFAVDYLP
ncbi:hypothetical protein BST22_05230 [Mycolicibacterium chubuense]|uniref:Uncharacterized protein n=1 Tax=Mycolicibacterium chubuense TaxID=1800 RepID=A0A0J6ZHK1_MYCCU|nr:hypothetical protein [Mycolicibacterium chubuense]KMO84351.1 hypothetical protein MCHUDSM44219_00802 [Mycolicibacterium chubuense]ORA54808.1 hypothetical protein BST22_05230 [Mycolicibacterium chubuense]SPY45823.1 Uncharacterised protein [Mycolicibacterium chubuense]